MNTWTRSTSSFGTYPNLGDVLSCVVGADGLSWRWQYLWATAISPHGEEIQSLEAKIQESAAGVESSYAAIIKVCGVVTQVIDCLLVGFNQNSPNMDFVEIEFFDSTQVSLKWNGHVQVKVSELDLL